MAFCPVGLSYVSILEEMVTRFMDGGNVVILLRHLTRLIKGSQNQIMSDLDCVQKASD